MNGSETFSFLFLVPSFPDLCLCTDRTALALATSHAVICSAIVGACDPVLDLDNLLAARTIEGSAICLEMTGRDPKRPGHDRHRLDRLAEHLIQRPQVAVNSIVTPALARSLHSCS